MSGWTNQGITTLVIPTGATTGERIVIDGTTGAILDYDSSGTLIASVSPIDQTISGVLVPHGFGSYDYIGGGTQTAVLNQAGLSFTDTNVSGAAHPKVVAFPQSDTGTSYPGLALASGTTGAWPSAADVILVAGDPVVSGQAAIVLIQGTTGSTSVAGQAMATDTDPTSGGAGARQPWRRHSERYTGTVSGAAGLVTVSHNCGFTPTVGQFSPLTNFTQGSWSDTFGTHGFTNNQAQLTAITAAGGFVPNGTTVTFYAEFGGIA